MKLGTTDKVALISMCGFLAGATVLSTSLSGVWGVLAGPVIAIFGWFFYPPIILLTAALWHYYPTGRWFCAKKVDFAFFGGAIGLTLGNLIYFVGFHGPEKEWLVGYSLGGLVSGVLVTWLITQFKLPSPGP